MDNIKVGDTVKLNPKGLSRGVCENLWKQAGFADNASAQVTSFQEINGDYYASVVVGKKKTFIPVACLREQHMAGGGKKKHKVKSKRRKSKRRKSKRRKSKRRKSKK